MSIEVQAMLIPEVVDHAQLHKLEEMYSFRDAPEVQRFLCTHPHLIDVLLEAQPYLEKYFGSDPEVVLEVVNDRETSSWQQLFAYIRTSLSPDEAMAQLDKLDEAWFLDQTDRVDDLFNFSLDVI